MEILSDLWSFLKERKKYWLAPVIVVLLLLGFLIVFGGSSALGPYIYTLFQKMNKIKSDPSKTILVINSGLLIWYLFSKIELLIPVITFLGLIGVFSKYLSSKIEFIWFKLAYILGFIVPNIILALIYYFFLFPISLLSKLSSKDTLSLKNTSKSMYKNVNKTFEKSSFKKVW